MLAEQYVYKESCLRCPNRYWVGNENSRGTCEYCPQGGIINTNKNQCDYCLKNNEILINGECVSCTTAKEVKTTQEECNKCPNNTRFWDEVYMTCQSCDLKKITYTGLYVSKDECLRCNNRYTIGRMCAYCPDGGIIKDNASWCDYCTQNTLLHPTLGECVSCSETTTLTVPRQECNKCSERFWEHVHNWCFPCDKIEDVSNVTQEDCLHCDNRYYLNRTCKLCPDGKHHTENGQECE